MMPLIVAGGSNTLDIKGHQDACGSEPECV